MQKLECHGDWLIEYADGDLPPHELAAAEQHLSQCPACQREVAALQSSGAQLSGYFANLRASRRTEHCSVLLGTGQYSVLLRTEHCSVLRGTSRWTIVAQRAAAVAACVALVALGYWLNRLTRVDVRPFEVVQHVEAPREIIKQVPQATSHADIAAEIARETQIARLRAAIAILKDEPGMSERSEALQQYLVEAYQVDLELPAM